ncbi:MAG: SpoIIIAH-like family protein [Firmicutes bacterium]|nr:SpoIIIAH-like family protein [Bacillota bacterium]
MNRKEWEKVAVMGAMILLLVGAGVLGQELKKREETRLANSGYVRYEEEQMAEAGQEDPEIGEHDGEVLVDSLELSALPGKSTDTADISLVTSDEISDASGATGDGYFAEQRATLDMDRDKILSMLTSVIEGTGEDGAKANAAQQKLKLIEYMDQERTMESLIGNKGYANVMVVMTDSSVTVTIGKQTLSDSDVAKIMDIVLRETGRSASQVVIQCKN